MPALHPWNTGFEWVDHTGPYRFLDEKHVRRFDEQGFTVLDHVFSPEELAPVVEELDRFEAKATRWLEKQENERFGIAEAGAITFAPNLVARSPLLAEFTRHPALVGIAGDLLGPDVNLYWDQAVYKKPEKPRRFPWHQDNGYKFVEPQMYVTCWIALTDAAVENGCPQVAPGLHRLGTLAHHYVEPLGWECLQDPDEVVAAPVEAGGIVLFSSLTPHLTGPNTTSAVRKAYIVQYATAGSIAREGDPRRGLPDPVPQDDPTYQYPVLRGGEPVR